ncbi:MAG TPA: TonB-dependent receptor [Chitinophaga sp.]|uniref:SusC/RagA family TonB-linked outer membrane protein n=1 Tax=Chitinophaga sp. TaxID=1869181 RepID=UPI002BF36683|nr:TonB-dependent receptor [Chitinophaga sp.]HVI48990.1 TonB-dependent receptor [Chitinophaga sp.]
MVPLSPGATVTIKGTRIGTTTSQDGRFTIKAPSGSGTLVISYVGYTSAEITYAGESNLHIKLTPLARTAEEVVVVGYGSLKRKTLASSVSTVKGEALTKSTSPNVSNAISGKIAGVIARQADGRPGSTTSFNIRGMGDPLYVVDGIPKDAGQFNNIDMGDIESVTVLKDGAATAIWGIGAANGVIQITTRKGKYNQKPQLSLNTYYGMQDWTRFPKMANAAQYYEAQTEADVNEWIVNPNRSGAPTTRTKAEWEKWKAGTEPGYQSFDWSQFIRRNAPQYYANMSISGGGENVTYYTSLAHLKQDGAIKDFVFQRTNLQSNVDARLSQRIKIGTQINARVEQRKNPGLPSSDDLSYPLKGLYINIPTERPYANDNPKYPSYNGSNRTAYNFGVLNYDQSGFFNDTWRVFQGNIYGEYITPIKGLVAKVTGNYYYAARLEDIQEYTFNAYRYDKATDKYNIVGGNPNPYREKINESVEEKIYQAYLNYDNTFGKHTISATLGLESNERFEKYTFIRSNPTTNFISLIRPNEFRDINDTRTERGSLSVFGRANYTYNGKYIFGTAIRRDKSSVYSKAFSARYFPGFDAGWIISEENFFKGRLGRTFSLFKLRGSYSVAGLLNKDVAGAYLSGYNFPSGGYVFDDGYYIAAGLRQTPSTNITWVQSRYTNIGLDMALLNNKLSLTVDVFQRKKVGDLTTRRDVNIPQEVAQSLPQENLNSSRTLGTDWEITYNGHVKDVKFTIGVNGVYARTQALVTYREDLGFGSSWDKYKNATERRWTGTWGYIADGQFQSMDQIRKHPIDQDGQGNTTLLPGDIIYKDINGDGVITALDQRPIARGGGLPLFNAGLNIAVAWKNFDLTLNLQGASGYYFNMANELQRPFLNDGNIPTLLLDRWRREDPFDPNSAWIPGKYPSIRRGGIGNNLQFSTFNTVNVRYLRLRNLEVGYTLPRHVTNRLNISKARFYFNAMNLLTFTNVLIVDPELDQNGGVQYPQTKNLSFGLNVSF